MSKTITITLPDRLEQAITQARQDTQTTEEQMILQLLTQLLTPLPDPKTDPLLKLIGCINSDITDVAENHDNYLGQALYEELQPHE